MKDKQDLRWYHGRYVHAYADKWIDRQREGEIVFKIDGAFYRFDQIQWPEKIVKPA